MSFSSLASLTRATESWRWRNQLADSHALLPAPFLLLEQDLRHHALILVIQQMTMKYRHAFDDGIGEVQNHINRTLIRNIHCIQPHRVCERAAVFGIGQKMHLVYVEGMEFSSFVDDTPVVKSAYPSGRHWRCIRRKLVAVDVEAALIFRENDREVRCNLLQRLNVDRLVDRLTVIDNMHLLRLWI